jgi:hypothetical protein
MVAFGSLHVTGFASAASPDCCIADTAQSGGGSGPYRTRCRLKAIRLGIIMNGVTGPDGNDQHLVRSINAIRAQGGIALQDGRTIMPDPILVDATPRRLKRWRVRIEVCAMDDRPRCSARRIATTRSISTRRRRHAPRTDPQGDRAGNTSTRRNRSPRRSPKRSICIGARKAAGVRHGVVQDKLWLPAS